MSILLSSQRIEVMKNAGTLVTTIDAASLQYLESEDKVFIRHTQPFMEPGMLLVIPRPGNNPLVTSPIKPEGRTVGSNFVLYQTRNSEYKILYYGIDLKRVLQEGINKQQRKGEANPFPSI